MSDLENPLEEESRAAERYEAWKAQGAIVPFGYSFMGLLLLGVAGCFKAREVWNSPMWPVVLVLGGLFAAGIVSLFLDLPRRQLSPVSRVFLGLGVFVIAALGVMNVLARWF